MSSKFVSKENIPFDSKFRQIIIMKKLAVWLRFNVFDISYIFEKTRNMLGDKYLESMFNKDVIIIIVGAIASIVKYERLPIREFVFSLNSFFKIYLIFM